jgi:flagellar basal body-associated protein FliL
MSITMSPKAAAQQAQAEAAAAAEAEPEEKKKGKGKLLVIVVLGAALLGAAAYFMVLKPMLFPPHYKPGQAVPPGKIVSLPQDTINLSDGHLLQVTVALQLTAPAQSSEIDADNPKFLNAELDVFGALTYPDLLDPSGRAAAQAALLAAFQKIAGTSEGAQQVSAIYFTNFIAQ